MAGTILGIDPGTRKAGYAVVAVDGGPVLAQGIEPLDRLALTLADLRRVHPFHTIAVGRGTNAAFVRDLARAMGLPVHLVDETETTLQARQLYFADHPPRGWRRLIPLGMQLPPRSIDDYAAVLIARRFLNEGLSG